MSSDEGFMREALREAAEAEREGEVPVGAVVVHQGRIVGRGHNRNIASTDPSAHAELEALRQAARGLGNHRLEDCTLYVTLEPCLMCSGAILGARIARVVYGAAEPKTGAAGSVLDVFADPRLNPHTGIEGGVLAGDCGTALQRFFQARRQAQQAERSRLFLRDDALRPPASAQPSWPEGLASHHVHDLPALEGHRLHVLQGRAGRRAVLALHSPTQWSLAWAPAGTRLAGAGLGLAAPDLLGFGLSDKPKKPGWHRLDRHAQVLREWLDRQPEGTEWLLASPPDMHALAALLWPHPRLVQWIGVDPPMCDAAALQAAYPDAGHGVGPRLLPGLLAAAPQVQPPQHLPGDWVAALAPMGYSGP